MYLLVLCAHTNCNADSSSMYVYIVDSYNLSVCIVDWYSTRVSILASNICLYCILMHIVLQNYRTCLFVLSSTYTTCLFILWIYTCVFVVWIHASCLYCRLHNMFVCIVDTYNMCVRNVVAYNLFTLQIHTAYLDCGVPQHIFYII